jgi:uncharacterized protein
MEIFLMIIELMKAEKFKTCFTTNMVDSGLIYEAITGSKSYGLKSNDSDIDIVSVMIPPKNIVFPHLQGIVFGFEDYVKFETSQQHHIQYEDKQYDLTLYNIVHYFRLCMNGNPNMIDTLYSPNDCVLYVNSIGNMIRDRRKVFLSKKIWHTFKGYSYSQMNNLYTKKPEKDSKRAALVEKYGMDTKFAYHVIRLLLEAEQILKCGDLTLDDPDRAIILQEVREGTWTIEKLENFFNVKEKQLEEVYNSTTVIPHVPDKDDIKKLLLDCLEEHFGNLPEKLHFNEVNNMITDIEIILNKYRGKH